MLKVKPAHSMRCAQYLLLATLVALASGGEGDRLDRMLQEMDAWEVPEEDNMDAVMRSTSAYGSTAPPTPPPTPCSTGCPPTPAPESSDDKSNTNLIAGSICLAVVVLVALIRYVRQQRNKAAAEAGIELSDVGRRALSGHDQKVVYLKVC